MATIMKSIKEKADEKYPITTGELQTYNEKFVEGANNVLDEIEKLLPKEDKNLNDYGKALVWRIKDTIEQLKK